MDTPTTLILAVSIGGPLLVFNAVLFGIILYLQSRAAAARGWPSVQGTVMTSTLEHRRSSDDHGYVDYPVVRYTYAVQGERYEGNRLSAGPAWGGTGAERVLERYPVGARVTVYYDARDPSQALLERSAPPYLIWLWVAVIVLDFCMLSVGGVMWWAFSQ
jgi:hypothetical protein